MGYNVKKAKNFDICEKKFREITSTKNLKDAVMKCARRRRPKVCQGQRG